MKRLFTTTALAASMALASAAYAASDDAKNAPREVTPSATEMQGDMDTQDRGMQGHSATGARINAQSAANETSDALDINGDAAVMSETAISTRDLIGATVIGPDGETVGSVNDIVFDDDNAVEQVVVTDGGILGYGGKDVAIDFEGASVTRDENDERMVRIGMTSEALESVAEFDKAPYEDAGNKLGSAYLDREVQLASADDNAGSISDLILDSEGSARYAVIDFGGLLEMGDTQVAVKIDELTPASTDEPFKLAMTEDQLRQAPKFHYDAEDVANAGEM